MPFGRFQDAALRVPLPDFAGADIRGATIIAEGRQPADRWILPWPTTEASTNTGGTSAPYAYLHHMPWWVPRPFWIDALALEVQTATNQAGAVMRLGIWPIDRSGAVARRGVHEFGTVAIDSTGRKTATFPPYRVEPPGALMIGQCEGFGQFDTQPAFITHNNVVAPFVMFATFSGTQPPGHNSASYAVHLSKGATGRLPASPSIADTQTQSSGISNRISIWGRLVATEAA